MIVEPRDVCPGEGPEKVARALAQFSVDEVQGDAAFDEGYRALEAFFGPKGEIERREVLAAWLAGEHTDPGAPISATYHMLLARSVDDDGRLAGARDCFVTLDRAARRCVVLLSHALVLPDFRRTGLGALLRAAPVALARRALREAGLGEGRSPGQASAGGEEAEANAGGEAEASAAGAEILLAAEMEAVDPDDRDTAVRLFAYGRAGFAAIPPAVLPYAQPDFRDTAALGVTPVPVPLVAVVRQVGAEERADISRAGAASFLRHYQAVHARGRPRPHPRARAAPPHPARARRDRRARAAAPERGDAAVPAGVARQGAARRARAGARAAPRGVVPGVSEISAPGASRRRQRGAGSRGRSRGR
ncbi:MAG TPA: hypothetical protein VL242_15235 [Sorangium sp.]|nr:hypothetical protein [Sorangium sp.]